MAHQILSTQERQRVRAYALGQLQGSAAEAAQQLVDHSMEALSLFEETRDLLVAELEQALDGVRVSADAVERLLRRVRAETAEEFS